MRVSIECELQDLINALQMLLEPKNRIPIPDRDGDVQCEDCDRFFVSKLALGVHRSRAHKVIVP